MTICMIKGEGGYAMLEQKDLEMIAETVKEMNKPIYERLDKMDRRFDEMDHRLDKMDHRFDEMDHRFDEMDHRLDKVEKKVTEVQVTLENETNKGIQIVGEGHLDLSRKLDEALTIENEKEMLKLRINRLESEVKKINAWLEEIA